MSCAVDDLAEKVEGSNPFIIEGGRSRMGISVVSEMRALSIMENYKLQRQVVVSASHERTLRLGLHSTLSRGAHSHESLLILVLQSMPFLVLH